MQLFLLCNIVCKLPSPSDESFKSYLVYYYLPAAQRPETDYIQMRRIYYIAVLMGDKLASGHGSDGFIFDLDICLSCDRLRVQTNSHPYSPIRPSAKPA